MSFSVVDRFPKPLREPGLTELLRNFGRAFPVIRSRLRIGAELHQQLGRLEICVRRRPVERREPILLPRVRIGAALQEKPYRRAVADGHGRMNRRYTQWIFCGRVHVRAALDQLAGELRMAKENRQADRRKTVLAVSVEKSGLL